MSTQLFSERPNPAAPRARTRRTFVSAMLAVSGAPLVRAQQRPYTVVVPFPPGGGTDLIARALARQLAIELQSPVIVENRAGAGGLIGVSSMLQAPADGRTFLLSSNGVFSVIPALRADLPYDPGTSFADLAMVGTLPMAVLVKADAPWRTLKELLAAARDRSGALAYGSFGAGSVSHFAAELLLREAGVSMLHVPYKGSAPAVLGLLADDVAAVVDTASTAIAQTRSGRVRCLAVTSARRYAGLSAVPTASEAGVLGFEFDTWVAIVTRRDVAPGVLAGLRKATQAAMSSPELRRDLMQQGLTLDAAGTPGFDVRVRTEIPRYRAIAARAGIRLD